MPGEQLVQNQADLSDKKENLREKIREQNERISELAKQRNRERAQSAEVNHLTSKMGKLLANLDLSGIPSDERQPETSASKPQEKITYPPYEVDRIKATALSDEDIEDIQAAADRENDTLRNRSKVENPNIEATRAAEREKSRFLKERQSENATRHYENRPMTREFIESSKPLEPQVERTPDYDFERASDKLLFNYKKHREEYLIGGAIESLSQGDFSVDLGKFAAEGLRLYDQRELKPEINQPALWKSVEKRISDREKFTTKEQVAEIEHTALLTAIADGAYTEPSSPTNPKPFFPALPIRKHREQLDSFLPEYGIDTDSPEVREASYEGFGNIIEALKDGRVEEQEFSELDWYFDRFKYADHFDEFSAQMEARRELSDEDWGHKYDQFMADHNKLSSLEEQSDSIPELADAEEIPLEDFLKMAKAVDIFPETDSRGPRAPYTRNRTKNYLSTNRTMRLEKIRDEVINNISEKDPFFNIYYKSFNETNDKAENANSAKEAEYVIVRFGYGGYNLVIAESLNNGAMYLWHGQTGEDREAWRADFSGSKQEARANEHITSFNHTKALKTLRLNGIDNCWHKAWRSIYGLTGKQSA